MIEKNTSDQQNSTSDSESLKDSDAMKTSYVPSYDTQKSGAMGWVGPVVAIIVLLLVAGSSYAGYTYIKDKLISTGMAEKMADESSASSTNDTSYETSFINQIPSSCGYTIGMPDTIHTDSSTVKQWFYEEVPVGTASINNFGPTATEKNGVLMGTIFFKSKAEKFDPKSQENYTFKWPGLVSYCTDNTDGWDLTAFTENAVNSSNDNQTITTQGNPIIWGEVQVQEINMTGVADGQFVNQPFYLAVIPADSDVSRLVVFQPWGSNDDRLSDDLMAIEGSLKNRELSEKLTVSSAAPAQQNTSVTTSVTTKTSSCTDYVIREGIFASDKCYNSKDLADLQYYIGRYNSAVFSQNAAASGMKITCSGSEFFKDECEEDKQQYDQAIKDQEQYKGIVQGIIAKGK